MVRLLVAFHALLIAIAICEHQRHFVIQPSVPATWLLPLQHRCGLVLIASILWLLLEVLRFAGISPRRKPYPYRAQA